MGVHVGFLDLLFRGPVTTPEAELAALKRRFDELPRRFPRGGMVIGGSGARILATVSGVCDDAIRAIQHGLDVNDQPIARHLVAEGLRRLIADSRQDLGRVATVLNPEGVRLYTQYLDQLEGVARKLR
jgi:hypothetical protein